MVNMNRNKWLWVFVILMILNLIFAALTAIDIVKIESLYINLIRAPLSLFAVVALVLALLSKK